MSVCEKKKGHEKCGNSYYVMEVKYMEMEVLEGRQVTSRGDNGDERLGSGEKGGVEEGRKWS